MCTRLTFSNNYSNLQVGTSIRECACTRYNMVKILWPSIILHTTGCCSEMKGWAPTLGPLSWKSHGFSLFAFNDQCQHAKMLLSSVKFKVAHQNCALILRTVMGWPLWSKVQVYMQCGDCGPCWSCLYDCIIWQHFLFLKPVLVIWCLC